jgi:Transposase DDE domain
MLIRPDIPGFREQLQEQLPPGFDLEQTARARGAFTRARGVKDAATLLQLAMAYGGCGMSLRETCGWAAAAGLAELKDPSLLERLCNAAPWLGDIVAALLAQRQATLPARRWAGYRLRALDATAICQPGADRTSWRLHVGYDLATRQVDQIELTDGRGGENLQRLTYRPGEIVLGDRIYARARNLRLVKEDGADFIVRMGWNSLSLEHADGRQFDLFAVLRGQKKKTSEVKVRVEEGRKGTEPLELRLVIWRKSRKQWKAEQSRLLKNARKRGNKLDPRTLEAAKYVMLVTSLRTDIFPASDVLAIYRFRWQIELAFKQMKSVAGLDELAAKKPELAQAWIYARLIAFLVAERNAGQVPESPPSESSVKHQRRAKSVPLAPPENGFCCSPRQHSCKTAVAGPSRRDRAGLHSPARATPQAQAAIGSTGCMLNLAPMRVARTVTAQCRARRRGSAPNA